jgi:hypothetical protein
MMKELLVKGMQLGVGITALVGVTSALTTLPIIGGFAGTIRDYAQSLFDFEILSVPIGGIVGTLGGLGFIFGFWWIATGWDFYGLGEDSFSPGAGFKEVTGVAKKIVDAV